MDVITYLVANGISFFWRQALEMAGCPYLYEEDEATPMPTGSFFEEEN